jgi:O-antigen/teichoic acid export membrane protein
MRRHLAGTLAVNLAGIALGLVTGVLTARGLEPEGRGVLIGVTLCAGVVGILVMRGLDEALIWTSSEGSPSARCARRQLQGTITVSSAVGAVAMFSLALLIQLELSPASVAAATLIALVVPLNAWTQLVFAVLRSEGLLVRWNAVRIVPQLAFAAGLVVLLAWSGVTVPLAIGALLVANVITASLAQFSLRPDPPDVGSTREAHMDRREVLAYGQGVLVANIPVLLSQRVDQLFLIVIAEPQSLGIYAVAVSMGGVLQALGISAEQLLFPKYAAHMPGSRHVLLSSAFLGVATFGAGIPLVIWSGELIELIYGSAYVGGQVAVWGLVGAAVMQNASAPLVASLKAFAALIPLRRAQFLRLGSTVVSVVPLEASLGIAGVGVAVLLGCTGALLALGFAVVNVYARSTGHPSGRTT